MNEPIKTTDITGKVYWELQAQSSKPISPFEIAKILNLAIKHGIVKPPEKEVRS